MDIRKKEAVWTPRGRGCHQGLSQRFSRRAREVLPGWFCEVARERVHFLDATKKVERDDRMRQSTAEHAASYHDLEPWQRANWVPVPDWYSTTSGVRYRGFLIVALLVSHRMPTSHLSFSSSPLPIHLPLLRSLLIARRRWRLREGLRQATGCSMASSCRTDDEASSLLVLSARPRTKPRDGDVEGLEFAACSGSDGMSLI